MRPIELGLSCELVMPGLVPGIHVLVALKHRKTWMAGTSPAMTKLNYLACGRAGGLYRGLIDTAKPQHDPGA
jgi:hypothetical protein